MELRILIADDEPLALDRTRSALNSLDGTLIVGEARNYDETLELIKTSTPDLIVLDIQMPGGSGLSIAENISNLPKKPEVIFISAFDHYATEAFNLDASDYLLKPYRTDRLKSAIERAKRRLSARTAGQRLAELELLIRKMEPSEKEGSKTSPYDDALWVPRPGGVSRVTLDSIIWVEASRDYLLLHTALRSYIIRETMTHIGTKLDPNRIIRVHRSAYVNKACIVKIDRTGRDAITLTLSNNTEVKVGASYRDDVQELLGASLPNRV